jgi:hypothetical protein
MTNNQTMKRNLPWTLALVTWTLTLWTLALIPWTLSAQAAFPDVSDEHPNKTAIEFLQSRDVISGASDGNFYPERLVNRAEFLKMALNSSPLQAAPGSGLSFSDVNASDWFYEFVREAFHRQIVKGFEDGSFKPAQTVIKVEALKMLIEAHGILASSPSIDPYTDVPKDAWFAAYVNYTKDKNLHELSSNTFNPTQAMTRGDLAEMIYRLIIIREQNLDRFESKNLAEDMDITPSKPEQSGREIQVTDGVKHSVPLGDILAGGPPKDGIPPIDNPTFVTVSEANELLDDEGIGVAFSANGIDRFYPHQITVWHEIVNDNLGGQAALISYCPLCGTGIVFEPILNGEEVEFGTSGKLWNSNLVMYDRKTDTYWSQVLGEAIVGELTGTKLKKLPYDNMRWKDWKKQFPNGEVLSSDTGFSRNYTQGPYGDYEENSSVFFPVDNVDARYHEKEPSFGIELNGQFKVYPLLELIDEARQFRDQFAGVELMVSFDENNETVDIRRTDNGEEVVPTYGFWFSWISVHPESEVYESD